MPPLVPGNMQAVGVDLRFRQDILSHLINLSGVVTWILRTATKPGRIVLPLFKRSVIAPLVAAVV